MAYTTTVAAPQFNLIRAILDGKTTLVRVVTQYNTYRVTRNELMSLSAHCLADLGMNRSMVKRVALEAAYGANC